MNKEHEGEDREAGRRGRIPAHILYPGMLLLLLSLSVGAQIVLYIAANSGGGVQIERDYYTRATEWDKIQAERSSASRAGLRVEVASVGPATQTGARPVILHITDAHGADVTGLSGVMRLRRPSLSQAVATKPLEPAQTGLPGRYAFQLPLVGGLWDFVIDGNLAGAPVLFEVRYEVRS